MEKVIRVIGTVFAFLVFGLGFTDAIAKNSPIIGIYTMTATIGIVFLFGLFEIYSHKFLQEKQTK